jgi:HSP20 family protein
MASRGDLRLVLPAGGGLPPPLCGTGRNGGFMATRYASIFMWADACRRLDHADRLQRRFFEPNAAQRQPNWEPPIDLIESGDEVTIDVALPGVDPAGVEIAIANGALQVAAERPFPTTPKHALIRRLELPYGRFERRIALPAGRYELARTTMQHGCLSITLRRHA